MALAAWRNHGRGTQPIAAAGCVQLCEVQLKLQQHGRNGPHHWIHATLTPDRTRVYRVDGKLQTGTQVRVRLRVPNLGSPLDCSQLAVPQLTTIMQDFLRHNGMLLLPGISIIKQAAVTDLADASSACTVINTW